jgi:hypothetical protein
LPKKALLFASCLWLAASTAPVLAWGPDASSSWSESHESLMSYAFTIQTENQMGEEMNSSFRLSLERFDPSPFRASFFPPKNDLNNELKGLAARFRIGDRADDGIEIRGGYVPHMRLFVPGSTQLDPDAYLGYVSLRIPLHRFYIDGGAFYGQNMDLLNWIGLPSSEDGGPDTEFFGYQIAGGYRFNDSLSFSAGWGQTGQGRKTIQDDLRTWYVKAQISLGWQIFVTPQMGLVNFMKRDGEQTREEAYYCGAKWQINF